MEPLDLVTGPAALHMVESGVGLPFQGGPATSSLVRLIEGRTDRGVVPVSRIPEAWRPTLARVTTLPPAFAGLPADRPLVMGIVNVTTDSFSGDGLAGSAEAATARGHAMLEAGADLLDIGGESTRPGAESVPPEEEMRRVLPAVRALAGAGAPVSIDTRNADTARAALDAGARIVNDISAFRHDPALMAVVAERGAPVVLMHMLGLDPREMQRDPRYEDAALEVAEFLRERVEAAERAGIPRERIAVDPGIGFGKTVAHNLALVGRLPLLAGLGCRILLGASRKGFLGRISGEAEAGRRAAASVAAALAGASRGASILRVHDVAETVQALRVWRACASGEIPA
ncbi:MAG: Dihydropteroate synthase [uncultured Acetobacteraceae bacterium]|uniref:dihydropteroate synthase n=1 Tax=uncultured Acetobacteraceae bacterium TaxID=169975 RepID=A0A6J4I4V8_9PROT|nr:MAG: Dihydropteroate synthase [uncultured Acetobacteraceae bacterium]